MKFVSKVVLVNALCLSSLPAIAEDTYGYNMSQSTSQIATYLLNLGRFLGYNLVNPNLDVTKLSPTTKNQIDTNYAFDALLGSIPVNSLVTALSSFVSSNYPNSKVINALANNTFNNYQSGGSGQNGNVGASSTIDQSTTAPPQTSTTGIFSAPQQQQQATYLQDPVSQAIFNILGTPDYTQCLDSNGKWQETCQYKYQSKVLANVIGELPNQPDYFSYTYNQAIIPQLNGNTLIAPLMYSTDSGGNSIPQSASGMNAQNQAQEVANFIRYVSAQVTPPQLPSNSDFQKLYSDAKTTAAPGSAEFTKGQLASSTLNTYFANLRTYAAQTSVGLGNLYYIMSRRIPQTVNTNNNKIISPSSQAQTEFTMSTWRLYNTEGSNNPSPQGGGIQGSGSQNNDPCSSNKDWVSCINNSSSGRVQKEIALLLAEINYQMYLDRQMQERILLTNNILLLQNMKSSQPTPPTYSEASDNAPSN